MIGHRLRAAALAVAAAALVGADEPARVEFPGWFSNPVFTADGKGLVYVRLEALRPDARTAKTQVVFWDVGAAREARHFEGPADDSLVGPVVLSPDGKRLAVGLWNTSVRLLDVEAGKEVARFEGSNGAQGTRFAPDGRTVGWIKNDEIHLADAATGQALAHFGREQGVRITALAFADGGKAVIAGHARSTDVSGPGAGKNRTLEHKIAFWAHDPAGGKKLHQVGETVTVTRKMFEGPPALDLSVSADGKTVFLAGEGGVQVCDAATGKKTRDVPAPWKAAANDPIRRVALSADGRVAALVSARGAIAVWDLAAGKELRRIDLGQSVEHVALSPDGKALAVTHQTPGRVGAVLLIYGL
jgi:WD40 repeat protein